MFKLTSRNLLKLIGKVIKAPISQSAYWKKSPGNWLNRLQDIQVNAAHFLVGTALNSSKWYANDMKKESLTNNAWNKNISSNFMVWKFCVNRTLLQSFCVSAKFPHYKTTKNFGILRSGINFSTLFRKGVSYAPLKLFQKSKLFVLMATQVNLFLFINTKLVWVLIKR